MNRILVDRDEVREGRVVLRGRRAVHIASVIRPSIGDALRLGIVGGPAGTATVVSCASAEVILELGAMSALAMPPPVVLVLAVPRPKVLARVIAAASSLGVTAICLTNAWSVEKSYFGSPTLEPEALAKAARLGCEQGGWTHLPEIVVHRRFMLWLASLDDEYSDELRLFADPGSKATLREHMPLAPTRLVRVAIGPEGGWIEAERESLLGAGFSPVSVADGVLKVETAVAVTLGQLALARV